MTSAQDRGPWSEVPHPLVVEIWSVWNGQVRDFSRTPGDRVRRFKRRAAAWAHAEQLNARERIRANEERAALGL